MAEKNSLRSDQESATFPSQELKRKKRVKLAIYISVFLVVQIIVITVIALTVMRVRTPKVRLGAVNVQTLNAAPAAPSFDINLTTQIMVKNTNFGPYKFDASTLKFKYEGLTVGQVSIPKLKAGMRSTKKINVAVVSVNSKGLPSRFNLGNVMSSGVLTLYSEAKLTGNVNMLVMKKKKSAKMFCSLEFNLSTKQIQYLYCQS